jgi:hypothetical protein
VVQDANDEVDLDGNQAAGLAGDEDNGNLEDIDSIVLAMGQDLSRMTTKHTTMHILESVRTVTIGTVSHLRCIR